MRLFYFLFLIFILFSCNHVAPNKSNHHTVKETSENLKQSIKLLNINIDTTLAKEWITQSITDFFLSGNSDMQNLTTAEYYEMKMDAMNANLELENSLSEEDFKNKWVKKYDLKLHPIQTGFLISGQDWGKIIVSKIYVKSTHENSVTFSTLITDSEFKKDYHRDIVIIKQNDKYLISDILEYD